MLGGTYTRKKFIINLNIIISTSCIGNYFAEPPSIHFCPYFYGFVHIFTEINYRIAVAALLCDRLYRCSVKTELSSANNSMP